MTEESRLIQILEDHRKENKAEFSRLGDALTKLSDATADLAQATVKMEARHERHDDAMRRMGKQLDDHEGRIRIIEKDGNYAKGSIKSIIVIAAVVSSLIGASIQFLR